MLTNKYYWGYGLLTNEIYRSQGSHICLYTLLDIDIILRVLLKKL